LATVGAAVNADSSGNQAESSAIGVIGSSVVDLSDEADDPSRARVQVPVRDGRLSDDVADEQGPHPAMIRIGDIGLEAPILSVGVDEDKQLDVPAADTVGWYEHSSLPGESGATVLAAHVDYGGKPGAFYNLADLRPNDALEVEMADGSVVRYRVVGNTQYDKTELPAEEVFRKNGDTVLQLITCGGEFDPGARSYLANVVVTAVPEQSQSF
jgi:LPXTG-site transpeptidase (sortase) family protein